MPKSKKPKRRRPHPPGVSTNLPKEPHKLAFFKLKGHPSDLNKYVKLPEHIKPINQRLAYNTRTKEYVIMGDRFDAPQVCLFREYMYDPKNEKWLKYKHKRPYDDRTIVTQSDIDRGYPYFWYPEVPYPVDSLVREARILNSSFEKNSELDPSSFIPLRIDPQDCVYDPKKP